MNIGLYKNGTLFCIEVTNVKNTGTESVADVAVVVTVPEGVAFNSGNFPQGAYDTGTDTWNVGTLLPGADLTAMFCYEVTDSTKGDYSFIFTISSPNSCEGCDDERQFCVIVTGTSCADVASCMIEWPETEQAMYVEGVDQVYAKTYMITQADVTAGNVHILTDLPMASRDVVRVEGNAKYLVGGGFIRVDEYPASSGGVTFLTDATHWTIATSTDWDDNDPNWILRVKIYYKKQVASLT